MTSTGRDDVSAAKVTSEAMTPEEAYRQRVERIAIRIQACFVRFLFVFQGVTQLPVTLLYLVDFAFVGLSPVVRLLLKLWACYLCLVGAVNWLCLMYYTDEYDPAKHHPGSSTPVTLNGEEQAGDHPGQDDHNATNNNNPHTTTTTINNNTTHANDSHRSNTSSDGSSIACQSEAAAESNLTSLPGRESSQGRPLAGTFCRRCQMTTPPRTRHCKKCEACIIRRDHHCELVGCCVGHRNQRFFVVLANYGIFVSNIGAYMTLTYLYHHHPEGTSLWNYFLPFAFFQGLTGGISGLQALLTYHAYMLVAFCPLTIVYFFSEISVILQGKTMHEVMKRMKHVKVTSSLKDRFRVVFGDHWWLSFLFPTQFFLPHLHNGMDFSGVTVLDPPSDPQQNRPADKKQD